MASGHQAPEAVAATLACAKLGEPKQLQRQAMRRDRIGELVSTFM